MTKQLLTSLLSHSSIHIISHIKPDGDCLGAQFGLASWLTNLGVNVVCLNEDAVPEYLHFLANYSNIDLSPISIEVLNEAEAILVMDGNASHRFGSIFNDWSSATNTPVYCIDHHPNPADIYAASWVETSMSSTCEMIYHLIDTHPNGFEKLSPEAAKCIYTGIITDTGSHAFDSVTSATLRASAHLLEVGAFKPNEIHEALYSSRRMKEIQLLGHALNTLEVHENGALATIEVHQEFYESTGTKPEDTEGIVNYALSIEGVKAALFLKDTDDGIKMSLRSKSELDVNLWAQALNGGGHKKAAGAKMQGSLPDVKAIALAIGKKLLQEL